MINCHTLLQAKTNFPISKQTIRALQAHNFTAISSQSLYNLKSNYSTIIINIH